jgi:DNA-binding transcriptional MerR regulator
MPRKKTQQLAVPQRSPEPSFRSGAVARMAQMPVATLRIWEQRYQAVKPTTAPSGHRLYSADDLQRVMLLRQLTQQGHAIGAIAGLDPAQLLELDAQVTHGGARASPRAEELKLVVVSHALAARLQRPALAQRLSKPAKLLAVFETLAEARRATARTACDLLIWQSPSLPAHVPAELKAAQKAWKASQVAVVYRFAGADAKQLSGTRASCWYVSRKTTRTWGSGSDRWKPALRPTRLNPCRATRNLTRPQHWQPPHRAASTMPF